MQDHINKKFSLTNFRSFSGDFIQCNCDLMWLLYFIRRERPFTISGAKCANDNKNISALVPEDFNCIGMYLRTSKLNVPDLFTKSTLHQMHPNQLYKTNKNNNSFEMIICMNGFEIKKNKKERLCSNETNHYFLHVFLFHSFTFFLYVYVFIYFRYFISCTIL